MRHKLYGAFAALLGVAVSAYYLLTAEVFNAGVFPQYIVDAPARTLIQNTVTAIYLDYRVFDTLFESLLLAVSVVALFHFIELDKREMVVPLRRFAHDEESGSELLRYTLSFMYALFIVLGIYIIVNGADSPGGGFQGGAALATLIMARYLVKREMRYGPEVSYKLEKLVYLLIVLAIGAFLGFGFLTAHMRGYMLLMNVLIGLKVALGFTAIFQKFIQSGREEDSH